MSSKTFKYKPIYPGFPWEITLRIASATEVFPEGATFKAEFRVNPNGGVLAVASTENGGLVRVDGHRVSLRITGAQTAAMLAGTVLFDLIRTDTPEPTHTGVRVRATVEKSVTTP